MYCVKCGVKLADTEKKCPLCETAVYHPEIKQEPTAQLYPADKMPQAKSHRRFLCGAASILFVIPLILTLLPDILYNGQINWFGYVAGAIMLIYIIFVLPIWFTKPHPVVFMACDFIACTIYLAYINFKTQGNWFLTFALPIVLGIALATCVLVALVRCVKNGKLYVVGGFVILLGLLVLMIEILMDVTFNFQFIGWSLYPLVPSVIVGILLIYLAINPHIREKVERRLFF